MNELRLVWATATMWLRHCYHPHSKARCDTVGTLGVGSRGRRTRLAGRVENDGRPSCPHPRSYKVAPAETNGDVPAEFPAAQTIGMAAQAGRKEVVCVTGAAGYVGSWLIMRLLEEGFTVKATVRDPEYIALKIVVTDNIKKTKHLIELPHAKERLTLWKADLSDEGSFDEAISGCTGVFHVATPMDFLSQDPEVSSNWWQSSASNRCGTGCLPQFSEQLKQRVPLLEVLLIDLNEVIKPAVNGMLNIMRSCLKAKTVRRVVFTSSAGTVNIQEQARPVYDEECWSDVEFCRTKKMTGWMYFVSKSLAERAAWDFAKEHNLDFISIIPTLVVGPFIMPTMPPSMITALSLITGNEAHYSILKQVQLVHLDDLCNAHIFLFDHPEAKGRYICSSDDATIFEVADLLRRKYPEYNVPTKFEGIDGSIKSIHFSSKKLLDLGFKYQYTMEQMFEGAVQCCQEKHLIPVPDAPEAKPQEQSLSAKIKREEYKAEGDQLGEVAV
ncbi:Dihydroflavonol-4-reductase [Nymphaea thermarum]|nr:Dihydroflavonol-4-reductase [Nymphaea thermarum]